MHIAIDLMGGDSVPDSILDGIKLFIENNSYDGDKFYLCGIESNFHCSNYQNILKLTALKNIDVIPVIAPYHITMDDNPLAIMLTKRNSTINKTVLQAKMKRADIIFSAGNSGATILTAIDHLKREKDIKYPGLLTFIPQIKNNKHLALMDVGASGNMAFKMELVENYLPIALKFYTDFFDNKKPVVGLLNVGIEKKKGTKEHIKAYKFLEKSDIDFYGNVEGDNLFDAPCDIILTGGFTGNVVLKLLESANSLVGKQDEDNFVKSDSQFNADYFRYEKIGGAVLLGVEGNVVIGHGKSSPEAVESALIFCREIVNKQNFNS